MRWYTVLFKSIIGRGHRIVEFNNINADSKDDAVTICENSLKHAENFSVEFVAEQMGRL